MTVSFRNNQLCISWVQCLLPQTINNRQLHYTRIVYVLTDILLLNYFMLLFLPILLFPFKRMPCRWKNYFRFPFAGINEKKIATATFSCFRYLVKRYKYIGIFFVEKKIVQTWTSNLDFSSKIIFGAVNRSCRTEVWFEQNIHQFVA